MLKEFAFRGNMLDLAVGIIIGAAFGTVVGSFAKDLLTPLVSPSRRECPYCTTSIPIVATRCLACTSTVEPVSSAGAAAE